MEAAWGFRARWVGFKGKKQKGTPRQFGEGPEKKDEPATHPPRESDEGTRLAAHVQRAIGSLVPRARLPNSETSLVGCHKCSSFWSWYTWFVVFWATQKKNPRSWGPPTRRRRTLSGQRPNPCVAPAARTRRGTAQW